MLRKLTQAYARPPQRPGGGARQSRINKSDRLRSYGMHHRDVARESLQRLLAAPWSSLMTWLVIAIALTLPATLYVLLQNAQQLGQTWEDSRQISVYLAQGIDAPQGQRLSQEVTGWSQVRQVNFVSAEQGLQEFKQLSGFGDVLQYLDENPLPAVLVVTPGADIPPAGVEALLERLRALPDVDQVQLDLAWVDRLHRLMALGQRMVWMLAVLLAGAVLLVVGNTVRLAIESRRAEIVVVKLVGATDAFVRRPFLYCGMWYGLGGGLLAWLLVNIMMLWLSGAVSDLVAAYGSEFELAGLGIGATLLLWLLSAALGLLGAWLAVGRHLSEIEPR